MEVTFEGIPSGDHESFCWDVSKEAYIKVTGREPEEPDGDCKNDGSYFNEGLYRLYPGDVIHGDKMYRGLTTFTIKYGEESGECIRCGDTIPAVEALCLQCQIEDC